MIHHVYANQTNAGDWLSALGIQQLLSPHRVTEHWCDEPFIAETIAALRKATPEDLIVIGGGGLFMDYFVPFWEAFEPIAGRVPFVIWGVGACSMKREQTLPARDLISGIVARSAVCMVRDEFTHHWLGHADTVQIAACPTLVAVPSDTSQGTNVLHVDHLDNVGESIYETMVRVGEEFAVQSQRSYRQLNNLLPRGNRAALANLLESYRSAALILTSRLHGCVIGLAAGRPVLAVSGDHKVESFMAAARLSEWVIDLDNVASIQPRLEMLLTQRPPKGFIDRERARNRAVASQIQSYLSTGYWDRTALLTKTPPPGGTP